MKLTFLEASIPLTKTFSLDSNRQIHTEPYPLVKNFTSIEREYTTIEEFYGLLSIHADKKHCLLKGNLDRSLTNESRASHTNPVEPTNYLAIDCDFDTGFTDTDAVLAAINPALVECDHIVQHSASSGIRYFSGLRTHIYLLTSAPVNPEVIKNWLLTVNLHRPEFKALANLSANGFAIRWGLDITTCQNDKLIYIAPPICNPGVTDRFIGQRLTLVKRKNRTFTLDHKMAVHETNTLTQNLINDLRKARGLPPRKARFSNHDGLQLLTNPEHAVVTGFKQNRGFCYLNLNGGDSWGYWFPEKEPEILFNFKGEPPVKLSMLAPSFYTQYRQSLLAPQPTSIVPYVFRDVLTDRTFSVFWNKTKNEITQPNPLNSVASIKTFCQNQNSALPDPIPDLEVIFDPTKPQGIDLTTKHLNLFRPTEFMLLQPDSNARFPTIEAVLRNICVDDQTYQHHLNWIAFMFQTRKKPGTAWLFSGTTGTGKGVYYREVLTPLFGKQHVVLADLSTFSDSFNSQLETALIVVGDEFELGNQTNVNQVWARLKTYITEDQISIRAMRTAAVTKPSFTSFIFNTNNTRDPLPIDPEDRRINIAPPCERKLTEPSLGLPPVIAPTDITNLIPNELTAFAQFLLAFQVNDQTVRTSLKNSARNHVIRESQTTIQRFFAAIREANLDFFLQAGSINHAAQNFAVVQQSKTAIALWVEDCRHNRPSWVTGSQLIALYHTLINSRVDGATKFLRIAGLNRLELQLNPNHPEAGVFVTWSVQDPTTLPRPNPQPLAIVGTP